MVIFFNMNLYWSLSFLSKMDILLSFIILNMLILGSIVSSLSFSSLSSSGDGINASEDSSLLYDLESEDPVCSDYKLSMLWARVMIEWISLMSLGSLMRLENGIAYESS